MANQLFAGKNRDESHAILEKTLAEGKYPHAECREDPNKREFSVWDGPESPHAGLPSFLMSIVPTDENMIERIAAAVALKLGGK